MINKQEIKEHCIKRVKQKIQLVSDENNAANEALADDSKSTAGDKHETSRAMLHLEQEKNAKKLSDLQQQLQTIEQLDSIKQYTKGEFGSLIETNKGYFYLSISLGAIEIKEIKYFALSVQSPLGKVLIGKKANDSFTFNNMTYKIISII